MKKVIKVLIFGCIILSIGFSACQSNSIIKNNKKTIVVTYSILGSVVKDLVGDKASVIILIPDGQDPHEWEPSARDIETLTKADLIVQNGLGLEGGMEKALMQAKEERIKFFTASEHITVRHVAKGEGIPSGDPDQIEGAEDPHLWMDPVVMKSIVDALNVQIKNDLQMDVSEKAVETNKKLDGVNDEILKMVNTVPQDKRKFVTGHESMGYFAQRYGFKLVGAVIPSLTSQAEVSASDMADLKKLIKENQVGVVFSELGTPSGVSDTIGKETGVKVIEITTHKLPEDGSYFTFMRNLAKTIVDGLK